MKRSKAAVAVVVLLPVAVFVAAPAVRFLHANQEVLTLDDTARHNAPGAFVKLSEGFTHYQAGGPESGRPLLLINGLSTPYNVWDPTYEGLTAAGVRVLRYDLYGRGWSDRPYGRYDAAFFDRQALELIDALRIPEVDVAGVSMGGPIAAAFANRHPRRVRRVLLFDPGYLTGYKLPFGMAAPLLGEYNMAVTLAPGLPKSQWADFEHPERYPHYLDPYYEQMRYRGFRRAILATIRHYLTVDSTGEYDALGRSGKPVLLVWGTAGKDVPFALSEKVRAAIPQAEFHAIEGGAHIPHYEHPDLVNPIVMEFLRR